MSRVKCRTGKRRQSRRRSHDAASAADVTIGPMLHQRSRAHRTCVGCVDAVAAVRIAMCASHRARAVGAVEEHGLRRALPAGPDANSGLKTLTARFTETTTSPAADAAARRARHARAAASVHRGASVRRARSAYGADRRQAPDPQLARTQHPSDDETSGRCRAAFRNILSTEIPTSCARASTSR